MITGILNVISEDFNISLALAGQLVTVYSVAFAIGTPIVISLTSRMGRKKLLIGSLLHFILGSLVSYVSSNISMLMFSRIVLGVSAGVYLVVAFGAAAKIVQPEKLGGAIGTIVFGFSSAMILARRTRRI